MTIDKICKEYGIKNYTINDDGSIDVDDVVDLSYEGLTELPLVFNKVTGGFDCGNNNLTSLKGCPKWIDEFFYCGYNQLTDLKDSPKQVGGRFNCSGNKNLYNINGYTEKIGILFYCNDTPLSSIFNEVDQNFLHAFNFYKIIKDDTVNLKRLKYVMDLYDKPIDLDKIQKYYRII
jgi:hypothetical protein